jgi:arginase
MTLNPAFTRLCSPLFLDKPTEATLLLSEPSDHMIKSKPGVGDQAESLAPIHQELASAIADIAARGDRPFAIVGDCCQTIPIMAGLERNGLKPSIVWLDSHGDFNTWETTPSGFLGGMPLAMMTGRGDQRLMQAVHLAPIADGRVVLADGRDLDPGERTLVEDSNITVIRRIDELDVTKLPAGPLYLHFDTDIIDATDAPAFLYPVAGGPSATDMSEAIAKILGTGRVVAMSVTAAWDAAKDLDGATQSAVKKALRGVDTSAKQ